MATEQELIDSVNALPETQAFYAQPNSITAIGTPLNDGSGAGDKGYVKTYTHFKTVDSTRVRENSVKIYVNALGQAWFLGSDPIPAVDDRPEPVTASEVQSVAEAAGLTVDTVLLEESSNDRAKATIYVPATAGKTSSRSFIVWRKADASLGYKEVA